MVRTTERAAVVTDMGSPSGRAPLYGVLRRMRLARGDGRCPLVYNRRAREVPMPSLSPKSATLQRSPIRKLAPLARAAEARGTEVIYLNIGQPDMPTPPEMIAELHGLPLNRLAYAPSEGLPAAREAWSAFFAIWGIDFSPDEILVTTGASEAVTFALSVVAGGGGEVLVFEPCYTNYLSFAAQADVTMVPVTLRVEDGYHFRSAERLRRSVTSETKAILLCNPSNPTGTVYTEAELEAVAAVAVEHDLFVICDEVYREFVFDGGRVRSFTRFSELADRIIVVDSVSKRFNACGVRIGCLATKNREVLDVTLRFCQARLSVATAEQLMVVPMLRQGRAYSERLCVEYQARRDAVYQGLSGIDGITPHRSEGSFYTMTRLPIRSCEDFAAWLLRDFSSDGETVCLAPGEGFYVTPGLGVDEVRIAFMYDAATLGRAMRILGAAVGAYPGRLEIAAASL
ncbi:MAG TPA: pyridoxal phosphate-dependent aminotransferase [Methylomirabilota bacterium]|nr:pyridoxal phosphate-dependent aminotransferase [Methylomirabilota bacterium]